MFRDPIPTETQILVSLAEKTGVFKPGEPQELLEAALNAFHAGELGENHQIKVWVDQKEENAAGWTYFAPSAFSKGVWDVWWIGAHPDFHGKGIGRNLLQGVEKEIRSQNGRVIIIETSSAPALERARRFYPSMGYIECGRIPNFYGDGDDKITFAKSI